MQYTQFGNKSGLRISRLGFGAMRLPMTQVDGKQVVLKDVKPDDPVLPGDSIEVMSRLW
jgi:aryl-alcohol dehydrogenase-like predicted oxidoreductase